MTRVPYEFSLIRYVPDVVKGEFVNIGVVLREAGGRSAAAVRFTRDWGRVRCVHANADIGLLEGLEQEISRELARGASAEGTKEVISILEDTLSNSVQITDMRGTLEENLATGMESLMRLYVESQRTERRRKKSGRALILEQMHEKFGEAWTLMNKQIRAARYTQPGDSLRIDCGYPIERERRSRMFQAVSLAGDDEAAKVLAYSAPGLRRGVLRQDGLELALTAVIEPLRELVDSDDEDSESVQRYRFAKETMEAQEIRVITVLGLVAAAETARVELGLA